MWSKNLKLMSLELIVEPFYKSALQLLIRDVFIFKHSCKNQIFSTIGILYTILLSLIVYAKIKQSLNKFYEFIALIFSFDVCIQDSLRCLCYNKFLQTSRRDYNIITVISHNKFAHKKPLPLIWLIQRWSFWDRCQHSRL